MTVVGRESSLWYNGAVAAGCACGTVVGRESSLWYNLPRLRQTRPATVVGRESSLWYNRRPRMGHHRRTVVGRESSLWYNPAHRLPPPPDTVVGRESSLWYNTIPLLRQEEKLELVGNRRSGTIDTPGAWAPRGFLRCVGVREAATGREVSPVVRGFWRRTPPFSRTGGR